MQVTWINILLALLSIVSLVYSCPEKCRCVTQDPDIFGPDYIQVACDDNFWRDAPEDLPRNVIDLSLSGNRLSRLSKAAFSGMDRLKTLYLARNSFTNMDDESIEVIKSFKSLHAIELSENPWDCGRSNTAFLSWVKSVKGPRPSAQRKSWIAFVNGYNTLCTTPPNLAKQRLDEVAVHDHVQGF